jgi:hypothetical protein
VNVSPTQSQVQQALGAFLFNVLPAVGSDGKPVAVVSGQQNRVPEPNAADFVIITPINFERLATNQDDSEDVKFTGSIAGSTLTVSSVTFGKIALGATVYGTGVKAGSVVRSMGQNTSGGVGTYQLTIGGQSVPAGILSAGQKLLTQEAIITVQLDVHGGGLEAGDMAQTISTAFRDEYATTFFAALTPPLNAIAPLHADDPVQAPFINDANQFEWRWTITAKLQVNQTVAVPQEYGDAASITLKDVNALFPPH